MRPEAEAYLRKAREDLDDARAILAAGLSRVAARCAYFAAFHAAEALIFEFEEKVVKTHSGVQSEFARLAKSNSALDEDLHAFLARSYRYKQDSDYGIGVYPEVTESEGRASIDKAEEFLRTIAALIERR